MTKVLKSAGILAIIFFIAGPLLLLIEKSFITIEASQQALPIAIIACIYFFAAMTDICICEKLRRTDSKMLMGFHLLMNVLRLLLSALIIIVYAIFIKQNLMVFVINVSVFYLLTMAFCTAKHLNAEKEITKNKRKK
ncbi:hypothetical protein C7Y71_001690 [Pseudoprevotella muciniphila]|uniref:Uncharacterized protein n=1 Tax=Pseudoprevotella muciniphila TaxID=2133944 RepID=A0A5P8E4I5_9BACT|nr:hypothetical protein [Pseudoprevotella muciniphila]QFQ11834.1 hypothetical protein C7Y71_001690 [Pseudoprevotella muciniphila]